MPSYGQSFSAVYPTIGQPGATEAVDLNTLLLNIVTCLEAKVSPSGININGALEMNGNVLSELDQLQFQGRAALSSGSGILYWSSADNELYWRSSGGVNVKITNGGSLNVAATGAITGSGYGSGGVEINWDSANLRYKLKDASGSDAYAHVVVDDVQLNDGSGNFLSLAAPAMGADYSLTFPNAVPAAQSRLMVSTGGVLAYETRARVLQLSVCSGEPISATGGLDDTGNLIFFSFGAAGERYTIGIPAIVGWTLKQITFHARRQAGTLTFNLIKTAFGSGSGTVIGTTTLATGTADSSTVINFADEAVAGTHMYHAEMTSGGTDRFYGVTLEYDEVIA